jgi:molybdenum-dependent DNA-binding transcriptional regulator ModE
MELDTRHLRMVKAVADEGSITRAATALGTGARPLEQGAAEVILDATQLAREGGLRGAERSGRAGDAALVGHGLDHP